MPALIFGLLILGYWGRVMRLAYKTRRRIGRAGNLLPPEPVGRVLRLIWVPVVLIWIVHPFVNALVHRPPAMLRPLYDQPLIAWAAVVVGLAAFGATLICWKRMGKSWRMGINPDEKTQLIVTGPYAWVRHPIYALSSLLMLATLAAIPSPLMILAAVLHLLLLQWEARREERHLLSVHGRQYAEYASRVGRFVPIPSWRA